VIRKEDVDRRAWMLAERYGWPGTMVLISVVKHLPSPQGPVPIVSEPCSGNVVTRPYWTLFREQARAELEGKPNELHAQRGDANGA
jgi:hypothetical protein